MMWLRSFLFNIFFMLWSASACIVAVFTFPFPRRYLLLPQEVWSRGVQWVMGWMVGIHTRIEHIERIPEGPVIIACKHQSSWETSIFQSLLKDPAIVMKRELMQLPFMGWYGRQLDMIPVDRQAGGKSVREMLRTAKRAKDLARPIIIFPEGTRVSTRAEPNYQPGIFALYKSLGIPVVPVALNSGKYWSRRSIKKRKGTIVMRFLEPIEPGLDRDSFMERLVGAIEPTSRALVDGTDPTTKELS